MEQISIIEVISEARASYLNRTWESYPYQSVMKQAVRNAIDNEIAEEVKQQREKENGEYSGFYVIITETDLI